MLFKVELAADKKQSNKKEIEEDQFKISKIAEYSLIDKQSSNKFKSYWEEVKKNVNFMKQCQVETPE